MCCSEVEGWSIVLWRVEGEGGGGREQGQAKLLHYGKSLAMHIQQQDLQVAPSPASLRLTPVSHRPSPDSLPLTPVSPLNHVRRTPILLLISLLSYFSLRPVALLGQARLTLDSNLSHFFRSFSGLSRYS